MFSNDAASVNKRLGYCNDLVNLQVLRENPNSAHNQGKGLIKFKRKQATLRNLLLGQPVPEAEAVAMSNSEAMSKYNALYEQYLAETDEAKKIQQLLDLRNYIAVLYSAWQYSNPVSRQFPFEPWRTLINNLVLDAGEKIDETNKQLERNPEIANAFDNQAAHAAYDRFKTSSRMLDAERKRIMETFIQPETARVMKLKTETRVKYTALIDAEPDGNKKYQLSQEFQEAYSKLESDFFEYKRSMYGPIDQKIADNNVQAKAEKTAIAQAFKDKVMSLSSVTQEDAQKWLDEKVTITKAVRNKCARNGITPEQFEKEIKDFYVLTNGRLGKISIDTKNHDRAYASKVSTHAVEGFIMLDNDFKLGVLWHELAHHLEADDSLRVRATRYIRSRSIDGDKIHLLRNLTGNKAYRSSERAYKTDMFNHYAAKVYESGETEVFSMGVEIFQNPEKLFNTMLADPATIEFVASALMQPKTDMVNLNKDLRDFTVENDQAADGDQQSNLEDTFKQLATLGTFTKGGFTMDDLPRLDAELLTSKLKAEPFGILKINNKTYYALKSSQVKFRSYRGRAMKGVVMLDMTDFSDSHKDDAEYFSYGGVGLHSNLVNFIQSQVVDRVVVMTLAMFEFGQIYGISDTKGEIGEGYLTQERLNSLKAKYLTGDV